MALIPEHASIGSPPGKSVNTPILPMPNKLRAADASW
jgi:hypothetical protein